jgi:hypothetical protein
MRNNNSSFYRTGDVSREPNQCSGWLNSFAEKMAVSEQAAKTFEKEESEDPKKRVKTASRTTTAVEVARKRQQVGPSIYEMMSAIVSGQKPKYSSVEEAVKDYQQRTGLAQVLQSNAKKNDVVDAARQVVQAAGPTGKLNKDEPEMGEVIQFPKKEISEPKVVDEVEPGLAKVLQLFRELDDNGPRDPKPHGPGTAVEATLFEVPELEEAAVDDDKDTAADDDDDDEEDADVDDTAYEGKQIRWLSDFINKTMAGKGAPDDMDVLEAMCVGGANKRVCRLAQQVRNHLVGSGMHKDKAACDTFEEAEEADTDDCEGCFQSAFAAALEVTLPKKA